VKDNLCGIKPVNIYIGADSSIENEKEIIRIGNELSLKHIYKMDKSFEAIKYIQKAIDIEPLNSEYWYILGDIQYSEKLYDEAINSYEKVCMENLLDAVIILNVKQ
jgi:tetratricopeptide (TPR) repeat protein